MFMLCIGLRWLVIRLANPHLHFLADPHLLNIQIMKKNIQITFHLKFMMKNPLANYHLFSLLMIHPWMLTSMFNYFLMVMMNMVVTVTMMTWIYMIMISIVMIIAALLPLFQAVHSMIWDPGHMGINKHLQIIGILGKSIMTNSMVSLECIFVIQIVNKLYMTFRSEMWPTGSQYCFWCSSSSSWIRPWA